MAQHRELILAAIWPASRRLRYSSQPPLEDGWKAGESALGRAGLSPDRSLAAEVESGRATTVDMHNSLDLALRTG